MKELKEVLIEQIRFNCDVSDVRYWGYFSICGLLMSLRVLYMSEHGIEPWEKVDQGAIQGWISQKEERWEKLEGADFKDLSIGDRGYNPFDVEAINDVLIREGLIYGAGYGLFKKPTFFLADLFSVQELDGYTIYYAKKEHARDLFSSPGMSQGKLIFLRLDPLKMLLWDKLMEVGARRSSALEFAFLQYGLGSIKDIDRGPTAEFEALIKNYSEVILYHELGEEAEDVPCWADMLVEVDTKNAEFFLRAIKDILADTSEHGPLKRFTERKDKGCASFCIALMDRYRLVKMYPELKDAFEGFMVSGDWGLLDDARRSVYLRAIELRNELVRSYTNRKNKNDLLGKIDELQGRIDKV